jgi:predicted Fe-S protein YdhL (DUF1289 family)
MDIRSEILSQMPEEPVESPCINICELGDGNICSGCYRSLDEIACWSYASDEQRRNIVSNTRQRKLDLIP